jgi:hypothetical protein
MLSPVPIEAGEYLGSVPSRLVRYREGGECGSLFVRGLVAVKLKLEVG